VPATPRDNPAFSSLGLIQAAVLGLTDPAYNGTADLEFIPNMDGFPNGRRLEDDVTRIELQAVSGVVLAAIGLWYDDYTAGDPNPVTEDLVGVLSYTTGVESNDKPFQSRFPYLAMPFAGDGECSGALAGLMGRGPQAAALNLSTQTAGQVTMMAAAPNPFQGQTTLRYHLDQPQQISIRLFDVNGKQLSTLVDQPQEPGTYTVDWQASQYPEGIYFARAVAGSGETLQVIKLVKAN